MKKCKNYPSDSHFGKVEIYGNACQHQQISKYTYSISVLSAKAFRKTQSVQSFID